MASMSSNSILIDLKPQSDMIIHVTIPLNNLIVPTKTGFCGTLSQAQLVLPQEKPSGKSEPFTLAQHFQHLPTLPLVKCHCQQHILLFVLLAWKGFKVSPVSQVNHHLTPELRRLSNLVPCSKHQNYQGFTSTDNQSSQQQGQMKIPGIILMYMIQIVIIIFSWHNTSIQ